METMTEAPTAAARPEAGPSEVVLKLAFPYLKWKELIKTGELVCKDWRNLLSEDDVWRPICDLKVKRYDSIVRLRKERGHEDEYYSDGHEILVTQMKKDSISRRSFREIFVLSVRMNEALLMHRVDGPDASTSFGRDDRTLREVCAHDYRWIVGPTIETLRRVFDDPRKKERLHLIGAMKERLLTHGRNASVLKRIEPTRMTKEALAASAGKYLLAAATVSSALGENAFNDSSPIKSTVAEMLEGIQGVIPGKELSTPLRVHLKRTPEGLEKEFVYDQPAGKKLLRGTLNDFEFPLSPVDGLCFLIHKHWPSEFDDDCWGEHPNEEARQKAFRNVMKQWWSDLGEPIRKLILTIYDDLARRSVDLDPLPDNHESGSLPVEILECIVQLRYPYMRGKMANTFWRDLQPTLCDSILEMYVQHAASFRDTIRQEYHQIYGEKEDMELNAKVLLDIFLEVIPDSRHTRAPQMTREYSNELMRMMELALDHWDDLAGFVKTDDRVLWNPETLSELKSLESKFGAVRLPSKQQPSQDYCTFIMLKRFLYQTLSSEEDIPCYWTLRKQATRLSSDLKKLANTDGTIPQNEISARWSEIQKLLGDYRAFSVYLHQREHAMIALIPLLPHLSHFDSKRLVYALFIQRTSPDNRGFSDDWLNFDRFETHEMPCAKNDGSDLQSLVTWGGSFRSGEEGDHFVLQRLFGLPLPENIITAMADFLLEQLYHQNHCDVDMTKALNATGVLPYMERFCIEYPKKAHIVWDCLELAIENAISVVSELDVGAVGETQRETFRFVTMMLRRSCIKTRAKKVMPTIRRMYEGTQFSLQPPNFLSLEQVIQEIDEAPRVYADTMDYYSLYHGEGV